MFLHKLLYIINGISLIKGSITSDATTDKLAATVEVPLDHQKRLHIRNRFRENWHKFMKKSQGADEIDPITGEPKTTWGGWGVTLIDSLDTLYIMGLKEEFEDAVTAVSKVDFTRGNITTSFFEVVIRNLGGLLSAYDLSARPILLSKAKALADVLIKDFDSPSGFPYTHFNFKSQLPVKDSVAYLANIGTCQLEFARLSILTGDNKYRDIAFNVYDKLDQVKLAPGVYNAQVNLDTGKFADSSFTWGAYGDSFFEYLLKIPIMLGSRDQAGQRYLRMFQDSVEVLVKQLIKRCDGNRVCLGRLDGGGNFQAGTQHLEFFVPGLLLLGGQHLHNTSLADLGLQLLSTFQTIPKSTATGLAPEYVQFHPSSPLTIAYPSNGLRPELAESLFYAHRATHHPQYRNDSWHLFQSFERYSKTNYGYGTYRDVNSKDRQVNLQGNMPSYFYAETYKYLYLTFCPDNILPLNQWVFNTEAHPFRVTG